MHSEQKSPGYTVLCTCEYKVGMFAVFAYFVMFALFAMNAFLYMTPSISALGKVVYLL